jgi:hypothetical protein
MNPTRRRGTGLGISHVETIRATIAVGRLVGGLIVGGGRGAAPPEPPPSNGIPRPDEAAASDVPHNGAAVVPAAAVVEAPPARVPEPESAPAVAPAPVPEPESAPAAPPDREEPRAAPTARRSLAWGWLSALLLTAAAGLLIMTVGNALSRVGRPGAEPLFWAGFLLIVLPVTGRLASRAATRLERGLLVAGVGLMLYLSKVLHDPFAFVYSDELVHVRNAEDILRFGGLFPENSILPVTVYYPGLEMLTAGLAQLSGLSAFGAGLVVIGVARLILMLALFLLFERVSGSARIAGLAAMVYVANPNFLFWSAQYSYQSLALPLAALAVLALAERTPRDDGGRRFGWMIVIMLTTVAVVMTHHLTAYALVGLLLAVSLAAAVGFGRRSDAAWGYVIFGAAAVAAWLLQVAPITGEYLGHIFTKSVEGVAEAATGTGETRELFTSSQGQAAPAWERMVGIGSVLLIALALPLGLLKAWGRRRRSALLVVLAIGAAAYLAILPLRLVPSAWETANRASDFLFVGIGLTVALGAARLWRHRRPAGRLVASLLVCLYVGVISMGGAVAGWPPKVRTSQPYVATVGGHEIVPQGVSLARWSLTALGPDHRFAADESNGRLLIGQGRQLPYVGRNVRARLVLEPLYGVEAVTRAVVEYGVAYAAVDRRAVSTDNLAGYFFAPEGVPRIGTRGLLPPQQLSIVDLWSTDRLFDSGDITVFDVRRIRP